MRAAGLHASCATRTRVAPSPSPFNRVAALLLVQFVLLLPLAHAGNNAGGSARLSWSRHGQITDLPAAPAGPTALYLLLDNAPDVQGLAVDLRWTPNDMLGPCYWIRPDSTVRSGCGFNVLGDPGGVFGGDSTYLWRLRFDGAMDRGCVTFVVAGDHCAGRPASFCLKAVQVMDANGDIDTLPVMGPATLLGGTGELCPPAEYQVHPQRIPIGEPAVLTIVGAGLAGARSLDLVGASVTVVAEAVQVSSDDWMTATVRVPDEGAGPLAVIVHRSAGEPDLFAGTVTASDTVATLTIEADPSNPNDCGVVPYAPPPDENLNAARMTCGKALCPSEFPIWSAMECRKRLYPSSYFCSYTITINGQPAAHLPVRLDFTAQERTGGHGHHDTDRPVAYTAVRQGNQILYEPMSYRTGQTDAQGRFAFTLVAPEVAGGLTLTLYSTDPQRPFNPERQPTDYFCVRVPNLVQFSDGMPGLVRHPGGTDNQVRHTSFHWAKPQVLTALYRIGARWKKDYPGHQPLPVNDLNLQFGGRFDITILSYPRPPNKNWTPPHCGHLWGRSADLKFGSIRDEERMQVLIWLRAGNNFWTEGLEPGMAERFKASIHGGDHYHLDF